MPLLDSIRTAVPASARENWYRYGGAIIVFLASWGYIDTAVVTQWTALVLGVITLLFAALHSTSSVRTALYLLLVAVQGVAGGSVRDPQRAAMGRDHHVGGVVPRCGDRGGEDSDAGRVPGSSRKYVLVT